MKTLSKVKPWYKKATITVNGKKTRRNLHRILARAVSMPRSILVHHINGNRLDNSPRNLIILPSDLHRLIHLGRVRIIDRWLFKKCARCNLWKPMCEFTVHYSKRADCMIRNSRCPECQYDYVKKWRLRKKDEERQPLSE